MGLLRKPTRTELDSAFDRIFLIEGVVSRRQAEPMLEILITTVKMCKALHVPPRYAWPGVDCILRTAEVGVESSPEQLETIASVKRRMRQFLEEEGR